MNKKQRWMALLAAAVLCFGGLTGCGVGNITTSSSQGQTSGSASSGTSSGTSSGSSSETQPLVEEKDVEDTLEGLGKYMASQFTLGEPVEMRGDMIGAQEKGYKYSSGSLRVELYAYDLEAMTEEGTAVVESVKKNGSFTIFGQTVENAYLSDSGKYLMIYVESGTSEEATQKKEKAIEAFQSFKAE